MKIIKYAFLCLIISCLWSCKKRLDGFLFNNDNSISEYKLDDYQGELALDLPGGYTIPQNQIHLFHFSVKAKDENLKIYAIYVGDLNTIATDTVILYCHGNKDHMDHYWPREKLLSYVGHQGRFGVLMYDYPGYGLSEGQPTEENMYKATNGAMKWLASKGVDNSQLVVYGYSLGSAPACKSVGDQSFVLQPNKIILESPIGSSDVMAQDASGLNMPASFFANAKVDNISQMKKCEVPLYWMHGVADDFLSIKTHGVPVYKAHTKSWKIKSKVPGASHTNVPAIMGWEEYKNKILQFILAKN